MKRTLILSVLASLGMISFAALSKDLSDFPEYTVEGLKRVPHPESLTVVYAEPGANLSQYRRVYITEPLVAFKKNWQRDQNRRVGTNVSSGDMDRIKKATAELFMDVFTKELEKGGYQLAHERAEDVLIVKAAVLDLDIPIPDSISATRGGSYSRDFGSMTMYVELYDSETDDLLAKALDKRESYDSLYMHENSRPFIRQQARRMMEPWAEALRKGLDRARQETGED